MNHTKIETCDLTTNPISGCKHKCWYCFARRGYARFHRSFKPTFHPDRLHEITDLKAPTEKDNAKRKPWIVKAYPDKWLVFPCSVSDIFAPWTPFAWADEVISNAWNNENAIFQFLTKSPEGIGEKFSAFFPKHFWIGVSVTNQADVQRIQILTDSVVNARRFVYIEPLLGRVEIPNDLLEKLDWMVIGKLTGFSSKAAQIDPCWVHGLIAQAQLHNIPLFLKSTIVKDLGEDFEIREFPKA